MIIKRIALALCATVLAVGAVASAQAQTQINQIPGADTIIDETPVQNSLNLQTLSLPGTSVIQMLGQTANNNLNQIGPSSYFGVASTYQIIQQAGDATATPPSTVVQNATNTNIVDNQLQPALSTVTAGGYQKATNAVNSANFAPAAAGVGDTGVLTQVVSLATLSATNVMTATVQNGVASVIGNSGVDAQGHPIAGYQTATGTLNTAGVLTTVSTNLDLQQKMGAPNTITATNVAIANSIASTSGLIDPSVQTLNQYSGSSVNQIDFQSVTSGNPPVATTTVVNLSGFQPGGLTPDNTLADATGNHTVGLTTTIGNVAAAYTGPTNIVTYNVGAPGVGGDGAALVTGVTQNTVYQLNTVTGGPGAGLNLSGLTLPGTYATLDLPTKTPPSPYDGLTDGFLQYVDPTTIQVNSVNDGPGVTGVMNLIVARVNTGSAAIVGTARTAASDPTTQAFTNQLNGLNLDNSTVAPLGGTLSGKATQVALNMTQSGIGGTSNNVTAVGYSNLAVANANSGPVSLTNVSQSMNQSINTAAAAYGVDFTLNQAVTTPLSLAGGPQVTLGSNNIQVAAGLNSTQTATISGAQQFINNSVNVAALGGVSGSSTITQTTANVNLYGQNQLVALNTFNASISGTQSAVSAINVIGK